MVGQPLHCVDKLCIPPHIDMDFTIVSTTVEFGPGEARETVIVPITDDAVPEEAETFTATLMSNTANVVVGVSEATITILENDQRKLVNKSASLGQLHLCITCGVLKLN